MDILWRGTRVVRLIVTGASVLVIATACGHSTGAAADLPTVAAPPAQTPVPPVTSPSGSPPAVPSPPAAPPGVSSVCDQLTLTLRTDQTSYPMGQEVMMTAALTNTGMTACTISSGANHGFTISQGGASIWTAGCQSTPKGHASLGFCPQYEMLQTARPGQVLTRSQAWAQQRDASASGPVAAVGAGSYLASEAWAGQRATAALTIS